MDIIWSLLGVVLLAYLVSAFARGFRRRSERALARLGETHRDFARTEEAGPGRRIQSGGGQVRTGQRDLGANVNPSQLGNEVDLWPDRTGPRTRRELGARHATDVTFAGDRIEHKAERPATAAARAKAQGGPQAPQEPAAADLAPEDEFGEDRPVPRETAPDTPPTQWHPKNHGVPGDHIRDGHHRSATAPERHSTATDPYAHAPIPGPNHLPPERGVDFPPDVRP